MNKLVEIRVSDAIGSITLIKKALEDATRRRAGAEALQKTVGELSDPGGNMSAIKVLIEQCERAEITRRNPRKSEIEKAAKGLENLEIGFLGILEQANVLMTYNFSPQEWQWHLKQTLTLLGKIENRLIDIQVSPIIPQRTSSQLLQEYEIEKPFWGEHLETVAGIVLRDEGYDDHLAPLADAIVRLCSDANSLGFRGTLNVLGRDQAILKDLSHTVFFRFPSWSVWGLPLMAHDVWHASERGERRFKDKLKPIYRKLDISQEQADKIWEIGLVQDCLADTFATFVLGPAYAFPCILLLLDVNSALDQLRAEIVFTTLSHVVPSEGEETSVLAALKKTWEEARDPTAAHPLSSVACVLGQDCHAVSNLLNAYWTTLRARSKSSSNGGIGVPEKRFACAHAEATGGCQLAGVRCELVDSNGDCPMTNPALIQKMCQALTEFLPKYLKYDREAELVQYARVYRFLTGAVKSIDLEDLDLRYVLYAAWLLRWQETEQKSERIKDLATRAKELCRSLGTRSSEPGLRGDKHGSYASTTAVQ